MSGLLGDRVGLIGSYAVLAFDEVQDDPVGGFFHESVVQHPMMGPFQEDQPLAVVTDASVEFRGAGGVDDLVLCSVQDQDRAVEIRNGSPAVVHDLPEGPGLLGAGNRGPAAAGQGRSQGPGDFLEIQIAEGRCHQDQLLHFVNCGKMCRNDTAHGESHQDDPWIAPQGFMHLAFASPQPFLPVGIQTVFQVIDVELQRVVPVFLQKGAQVVHLAGPVFAETVDRHHQGFLVSLKQSHIVLSFQSISSGEPDESDADHQEHQSSVYLRSA